MGKRMIVMILASLLLLGGAGLAVAGGALMVAFGTDSKLTSEQHQIATDTKALVTAIDDIQDVGSVASVVGQPRLRLDVSAPSRKVFIGIGPAAAVERYLARTRIDRVTDLEVDPFTLKTELRDGALAPGAPGAQTFWTAQSSGASPSLDWKVEDGSYRLVIMNADATAGVHADGRVGLEMPNLFAIGVGVLVGGVLVAIIGLTLVVVAVRMRIYPKEMTR
jgi:hypothetical protein